MTTIAVVDDQPTSRRLLAKLISELEPGAEVISFGAPERALAAAPELALDMLFVDYRMPGMNGIQLIERFRRIPHHRDVPIVLVTIADALDIRLDALEAGATDFLAKPYDFPEFRARTRNLLTLRHYQMNLKDRAAYLEQQVADMRRANRERDIDEAKRLISIVRQRKGRSTAAMNRLQQAAELLAAAVDLPAAVRHQIVYAVQLCDIGKSAVPDALLNQPLPLSASELQRVRQHTRIGARLLAGSNNPILRLAAEMTESLYEHFDGNGFPGRRRGTELSLAARVGATLCVLDGVLNDRPDRAAWSCTAALDHVETLSGSALCPDCVAAVVAHRNALETIYSLPDDATRANLG